MISNHTKKVNPKRLPVKFVELLKQNLSNEEITELVDSFDAPKIESIRTNKSKKVEIKSTNLVPWCQEGHYFKLRPSYTFDPNFHSGAYYVQEASSMFLAHVIHFISNEISLNYVLDLCAAPGGKSTLLLDAIPNTACLIANEVIKSRANILKDNIIKWGRNNCIVTNNDPRDFDNFQNFFDMIVVDAPCSGEGMFRKNPNVVNEWSLKNIDLCVGRQKRIVSDASRLIRKGGFLIYCTCTFNHRENIDNVNSFILGNHGLQSVDLKLDGQWGVKMVKSKDAIGYQFYPSKLNGEGFFISVLVKKSGESMALKKNKVVLSEVASKEYDIIKKWVDIDMKLIRKARNNDLYGYNNSTNMIIDYVLNYLRVVYSGVKIGGLNKNIFKPNHALALSINLASDVKKVELSKTDALKYLSKSLPKIIDQPKGWILFTYMQHGIGWAKNLGNRINNYLPINRRILKKIEN